MLHVMVEHVEAIILFALQSRHKMDESLERVDRASGNKKPALWIGPLPPGLSPAAASWLPGRPPAAYGAAPGPPCPSSPCFRGD